MSKTFEEWVKAYEEKTGDEHYTPEGFTVLYDKDRGYAQYYVDKGYNFMYVYEACGDGRYWYDVGIKICRDYNVPKMITICTRHILPYLRLMQFKIEKKIVQPHRHNGYKIEGKNHLGNNFWCWPAWWDEKKQCNAYYVVSEVTDNDKQQNQPANVQGQGRLNNNI